MALFRRKKKDDSSGQPGRQERDAHLPALTVDEARHLIELAAGSLVRRGHLVQAHGGVLQCDTGQHVGLENLSRTVASAPMDDWPAIVDSHISALADTWDTEDTPADPQTLLIKLRQRADIPETFFTYSPLEPLPGIVGVLAADLPHVVKEFGSLDLVGDRDEAYDRALRNIAALPLPTHSTYLIDETKPSTLLHFFHSADYFGAARVVVLPDLLRRALDTAIPPHGVIVALPTRHSLNVHLPQDADTLQVINTLAVATVNQYDAEPGPVSPHLFHIGPDMIATQLTRLDDEGKVIVTVDGPIRDMFVTLGLITDGDQ